METSWPRLIQHHPTALNNQKPSNCLADWLRLAIFHDFSVEIFTHIDPSIGATNTSKHLINLIKHSSISKLCFTQLAVFLFCPGGDERACTSWTALASTGCKRPATSHLRSAGVQGVFNPHGKPNYAKLFAWGSASGRSPMSCGTVI